MNNVSLQEVKPTEYAEAGIEARTYIDPEFALVHKLVEAAYREIGAEAIRCTVSDNGTHDFMLRITAANNSEIMESFSNRPA